MKSLFALLLLVVASEAAWAGRIVIPSPQNISLSAIPVCYDFGCKSRDTVNLPMNEWESVSMWFSLAAEREQTNFGRISCPTKYPQEGVIK